MLRFQHRKQAVGRSTDRLLWQWTFCIYDEMDMIEISIVALAFVFGNTVNSLSSVFTCENKVKRDIPRRCTNLTESLLKLERG